MKPDACRNEWRSLGVVNKRSYSKGLPVSGTRFRSLIPNANLPLLATLSSGFSIRSYARKISAAGLSRLSRPSPETLGFSALCLDVEGV